MAYALVRLKNNTHADPVINAQRYKTGHVVEIREDWQPRGSRERPPEFCIIKFPKIAFYKLLKYTTPDLDEHGEMVNRRVWRIRYEDLPIEDRNKLSKDDEGITVKATDLYAGEFDKTWDDLKVFFRDEKTSENETVDLK